MKIGLALNKRFEIPSYLFLSISKFCNDNSFELFIVKNNNSYIEYKTETKLFRAIHLLESKLSSASCAISRVQLPNKSALDLDAIICWGVQINTKEISPETPILNFCINDLRFDYPYSSLQDVINRSEYQLSIRDRDEVIYSFKGNPALTYSRSKEISIQKFSRILIKVMNCILNKQLVHERFDCNSKKLLNKPQFPIIRLIKLMITNSHHSILKKRKKPDKSYWDLFIGTNKGLFNIGNSNLTLITHDDERFWADPFLCKFENSYYIFMEEYKYSNKKGEIAVLKKNEDSTFSYVGVVLRKDYHLSFPYLIKINDIHYMLPESGSQKRLDIFICNSFPHHWSFYKTILSGFNYTDSSILLYQDFYWIFTSCQKDGFLSDEQLLLYYTSDLLNGEIIEHPCNPIAIGKENARMAGSVFYENEKLIRPAQNCSKIYGGSIVFMEIEKLNPLEYKEKALSEFKPFSNYKGTHTYNQCDNLIIVDAY